MNSIAWSRASAVVSFSLASPRPSHFLTVYPSVTIHEHRRRHQHHVTQICHAKKKLSASPALSYDQDELDPDFRESINQLTTDAVRAMLSDDMKRMEALRDHLFDLELFFEKEKEEEALLFVVVVREMLDHRILPDAKNLKGGYKKAFEKIFGIVEDSGWMLKADGDIFGAEMVDDELIPPTLQSEYR